MTEGSLFDPNIFLDQQVEGQMATEFATVPPGRYNMQIKNAPDSIKISKIEPDDKTKEAFYTMEVACVIDGAQLDATGVPLKESTGRDENTVYYRGFIDFTPGMALALGKGQNVALGKLREAVNLNQPGMPFKMNMLKGQAFNGEVYHEQDRKDPQKKYARVRNPLPLGTPGQ